MKTIVCPVSHDEHEIHEGILIRDNVANLIEIKRLDCKPDEDLAQKYGKLDTVELAVIDDIRIGQ